MNFKYPTQVLFFLYLSASSVFAGTLADLLRLGETDVSILQAKDTAEDSDSNYADGPFLRGMNAGPANSEPDEFLDEQAENNEIDEDESGEESLDEIIEEALSDTIRIDMTRSAMPIGSDRVTSPFGIRHYRIHKGIDVGLARGDTVRAAFPGKVTRVQYDRRGYGRYIVLDHADCGITRTVYAHLSKQLVAVGEEVEAGEPIGLGGSTGRSTGPHLHFETRIGNLVIDPATLFDFPNRTYTQPVYSLSVQKSEEAFAALEKEAATHHFYRVRPGDTLGKIARRTGTSVKSLCHLNGIRRNTVLRVGRMIRCS